MKVKILRVNRNEIEIFIPEELQTKDFADEYLKIQNLIYEPYCRIVVRFLHTLWIDNMAMIQLILILYKLKQNGKEILFDFEFDASEIEQIRFIKYLYDYGFIRIIKNSFGYYENENLKMFSSALEYLNLSEGDFEGSECLAPFTIILKREKIADYIKEVIDIFHTKFTNRFSEYEKDDFIFRMSIFLQETISNVFEHAFDDPNEAFCGVMIRYVHKSGAKYNRRRNYFALQNNTEASRPFRVSNFTYKNYVQVAEEYNPYRNSTGIKVLEDYMQIFVMDVGMGLLKSMNIDDVKMERNLLNEIFQKGARSPKKVRNTLVGGLGMLYQLLQETENFISIKGEYNWVNITCANKKDSDGTLYYVHRTGITSDNVLKGFSIVGYIDCDYSRKEAFFISVPKENMENVYKDEYILTDINILKDIDIIDFRTNFPNLINMLLSYNIVLCFVGLNLDKGIWSNKICNLFRQSNQRQKTLILVDIPEREIRKYELIFDGFDINVSKVILLSQSNKLAIFTYTKDYGLKFNRNETLIYMNTKKDNIDLSLYGLLCTVRKYESQKFWLTVSKTQKSRAAQLFINETVVWDVESNKTMNGYLDFSQACFDEKIRDMLLYQLFRLPNDNKEKYFESMDRFTEDLCESVNSKLNVPFREGEYICLQLGSVYVTGTSSKTSKLDVKGNSEGEYYYFRHLTNSDSDEIKINALLLWPSEEITNRLFEKTGSNTEFARLAKTPFLAPQGTVYFAKQHYLNINESIELKPAELYALIQEDSLWVKRLTKIAHIDMVDHHDYMFLNAISIFNKHYMESRYNEKYIEKNSFDYLLKNMYIALGRTKRKSYAKSIEDDIQLEYRLIVRGKIQEDILPHTPGLFIYLTDYETMKIVSKLRMIFAENKQKNIIPIAPISKKRGSSALLLSPVLMENIKERIIQMGKENPGQEFRVTIFIATVTSTKLQRELKHILYRLGANNIKCLSLIDRQRFPLGSREKESYNSFCKIDLPQLGSENRCKLCLGINYIEELKYKLISLELQNRCDQIAFVWGKAKESDNLHKRGIQAQSYNLPVGLKKDINEICRQYKTNEIEVKTDVGLILFSIENAAITKSMNFLMRCLDDAAIEDRIKILMISAHMLMFGNEEIVPADKLFLANYLYKLLQKQLETNECTALACIIILLQNKKIKEKLHENYKQCWQWSHFNNMDFIIASVGILDAIEQEKQDEVLRYWVKKSHEEHLNYLYGVFLLTDGNDITRHKTVLAKARESGWNGSKMDYISADNDAAFLEIAYQNMPHSYFANPQDYQVKRTEVISSVKDVRILLKKAIDECLETEDKQQLSERTINLFHSARLFNQELFMNTNEDNLRNLRQKIQYAAKQAKSYNQSKDIKCYVKPIQYFEERGKKYFCYLEDLHREIIYLISDFRHADKNNFMLSENGECYDGIVEVEFEEDCMKYRFINHVKYDFSCETVKQKKKLKYNRPTILSLRMLFSKEDAGQLFHYELNEECMTFTVELRIPYLHI